MQVRNQQTRAFQVGEAKPMGKWVLVVSLLGIFIPSTSPADPLPRFAIAWIGTDSTGCIEIEGSALHSDDSLLVITLDPPAVTRARVGSELQGACRGGRGVLADSVLSYGIRVAPLAELEGTLGVAILAPGSSGAVVGGKPQVRIPGDAMPYTFESCASHEGIHFMARRDGVLVWHGYYYLGFDLEPDCPEEESGGR